MRLPVVTAALALGLVVLPPQAARAESPGTVPAATAHAADELANAIAQGKITRTPTPTPTPTHVPTATPAPLPPALPTPAPTPQSETQPCWQTDEDGVAFDEDGRPVPCPIEDLALHEDQPQPVDEPAPIIEPHAVTAESPAIARSARDASPVAAQPASVAAPPPAPMVITRFIYVTPEPTPADEPTDTAPMPTATAYVWPTSTATAIPTATATATRTATPTPAATATVGSGIATHDVPTDPPATEARPVWGLPILTLALGWVGSVGSFHVEQPVAPLGLPDRDITPVAPLSLVWSPRSHSELKATDGSCTY